jgi:hypothetical protein
MTTKISEPIRREIVIAGAPYTVIIAPEGIKLARKGYRIGVEITWRQLIAFPRAIEEHRP